MHVARPVLDPQRRQIRLVELLPGIDTDDINCKLQVVTLDDSPKYEALSYVWGDINITRDIIIDGQAFPATINLETALRHLRKPDEIRVLWVDAICIDQDDNVEKTHQVRMMGDIFKNACQGLIWLGDPQNSGFTTADAKAAFDIIHMTAGSRDQVRSEISELGSETDFAAVKSIMNSPWWYRIWKLQEVVLPAKVIVVWGSESTTWASLSLLLLLWLLVLVTCHSSYAGIVLIGTTSLAL
jgi:hypothetical protein